MSPKFLQMMSGTEGKPLRGTAGIDELAGSSVHEACPGTLHIGSSPRNWCNNP